MTFVGFLKSGSIGVLSKSGNPVKIEPTEQQIKMAEFFDFVTTNYERNVVVLCNNMRCGKAVFDEMYKEYLEKNG